MLTPEQIIRLGVEMREAQETGGVRDKLALNVTARIRMDELERRFDAAAAEYLASIDGGCKHAGWTFAKHGRCCPKCNAFVVDWGD